MRLGLFDRIRRLARSFKPAAGTVPELREPPVPRAGIAVAAVVARPGRPRRLARCRVR